MSRTMALIMASPFSDVCCRQHRLLRPMEFQVTNSAVKAKTESLNLWCEGVLMISCCCEDCRPARAVAEWCSVFHHLRGTLLGVVGFVCYEHCRSSSLKLHSQGTLNTVSIISYRYGNPLRVSAYQWEQASGASYLSKHCSLIDWPFFLNDYSVVYFGADMAFAYDCNWPIHRYRC